MDSGLKGLSVELGTFHLNKDFQELIYHFVNNKKQTFCFLHRAVLQLNSDRCFLNALVCSHGIAANKIYIFVSFLCFLFPMKLSKVHVGMQSAVFILCPIELGNIISIGVEYVEILLLNCSLFSALSFVIVA